MAAKKDSAQPERVHAVARACRLLKAFRYDGELLRLRDFVERTSQNKTTTFRLLRTLEDEGFLERVGDEHYRSCIRPTGAPRPRIGFATRGTGTPFSRLVTESVQRAAAQAGVDLVTVINQRSPKTALHNADVLIRQGVELVIEYQTHERVASIISSRFLEAGIPVIAVEIPHPGATFFGANNYQAGVIGGRALGVWVQRNWGGQVDEIILLEEHIAGPLPKLRLTGMMMGMRECLRHVDEAHVVEIDGRGSFERAFERVRKHLQRTPKHRTVIAANNDPMALGALRAFEESGRSPYCVAMGQNASPDAREELRRPGTRLIGSVAYFPERFGDEILPIALSILAKKPVPPAIFTKHQLITPRNVDRVYPLDNQLPDSLAGGPLPEAPLQTGSQTDGSPSGTSRL